MILHAIEATSCEAVPDPSLHVFGAERFDGRDVPPPDVVAVLRLQGPLDVGLAQQVEHGEGRPVRPVARGVRRGVAELIVLCE